MGVMASPQAQKPRVAKKKTARGVPAVIAPDGVNGASGLTESTPALLFYAAASLALVTGESVFKRITDRHEQPITRWAVIGGHPLLGSIAPSRGRTRVCG